jgi:hypothetical protein
MKSQSVQPPLAQFQRWSRVGFCSKEAETTNKGRGRRIFVLNGKMYESMQRERERGGGARESEAKPMRK